MRSQNKAGYTATLVACGWAGAVLEKVTRASGQEPYAQKTQKLRKSKKGTDQAGCRVACTRLKIVSLPISGHRKFRHANKYNYRNHFYF